MKQMKNMSKRGLALFIALMMCLGMLQLSAFAAEDEAAVPEPAAPVEDVTSAEVTGPSSPQETTDPAEIENPVETGDTDGVQAPVETEDAGESQEPAGTEDAGESQEPAGTEDAGESQEPAGTEDAGESQEPAGTEDAGESQEPAGTEDAGESQEPAGTEDAGESQEPAGTENIEGVIENLPQVAFEAAEPMLVDLEDAECTCEYMCAWFWGKYINVNEDCPVCSQATEEELDPYTYDPEHPEDFVCQGHQAVIPGNNPGCTHNAVYSGGSLWDSWYPGGGSPDLIPASCKYPATAAEAIECMACGAKWLWKFDENSAADPEAHAYQMKWGEPYPDSVVKATCTEDGSETYTCLLCGDVTTNVIPAEGHKFGDDVVVVESTCVSDGSRTGTCTVCKETVTEVLTGGHQKPDDVVTVDATCTTDGSMTYTCERCHEEIVEVLPAGGHVWPEGKVPDSELGICQRCGATAYWVYTYEDGATPSGTGYETQLCARLIQEKDGTVYGVDADGNRLEGDSFPVIINESLMGKVKARTDKDGNTIMTYVAGYRNADDDSDVLYQPGAQIRYEDVPGMFVDKSGSWCNYYSVNTHKNIYLRDVREAVADGFEVGMIPYVSEPSQPNPALRRTLSSTSEGITVEKVYNEAVTTCVITYTIPAGYAQNTVSIDATKDVMEAYQHIQDEQWGSNGVQAGDTVGPVYLRLVNNSGKTFAYKDGSFVVQSENHISSTPYIDPIYTFDGVIPDEGSVPSRVGNGALRYLYNRTDDPGEEDLQDAVLGAKLIEKGYANGVADLHQFYLDYYNYSYSEEYNTTWSNLSQIPYKLLVQRDEGIFGGQSSTAGVKETNPEVAGVGYSYMYTRLLSVVPGNKELLKDEEGIYAVGNYMKGLASYNEEAKTAFGTLGSSSGQLMGMSLYFNGEINDFYQNTAWGIQIGFTMDEVVTPPPPPGGGDPDPDPTPRPTPTPTPTPTPVPEEPNPPEEEVPDEDVPRTDEPDVEVPDEEIPLANVPEEEVELLEEEVPLADVPETGDESGIWLLSAAAAGLGLLWMFLTGRKRKEDAEG